MLTQDPEHRELKSDSSFRILIIDDDRVVQLVLKKMLQGQGYEVEVTQSGEEGIIRAQQHPPALIICDWEMRGMNGLEVCRRFKADPELASAFFILLTGRSTLVDRVKGLNTGADDFLSKPVEVTELRARVRAGLRLYQTAQALRESKQKLQQLAHELQTQKKRLEAELKGAGDYISSLLPKPMTGKVNIDYQFLPSIQLGGDCFDYFWLDPDYLVIYLLDVSGHGLKSALPSVTVQSLLRTQSLPNTNFYQPNRVLQSLNETLQMSTLNEQYFTIWYGVYNCQKRQLFYSSAGHPPAVLISPDGAEMQQLKTRGAPIGMFSDTKFTNGRCNVLQGSKLYIFSDGIYEIKQVDGTTWTLKNFITMLTDYANVSNLDQLIQSIEQISDGTGFSDDCSLLQIKFA